MAVASGAVNECFCLPGWTASTNVFADHLGTLLKSRFRFSLEWDLGLCIANKRERVLVRLASPTPSGLHRLGWVEAVPPQALSRPSQLPPPPSRCQAAPWALFTLLLHTHPQGCIPIAPFTAAQMCADLECVCLGPESSSCSPALGGPPVPSRSCPCS